MAEAAPVHVQDTDADLCPVCTVYPKVARLLDCGHHFCSVCLEKLVVEKTITCPTCRYITQVNTGINALPRYRITNEFSAKVSRVTCGQSDPGNRPCDWRHVSEVYATRRCMECWLSMCTDCTDQHDTVAGKHGHKTFPVSSHMFCVEHDGKGNVFVCLTCEKLCCGHCIQRTHSEHNISPVHKTGDQAISRLEKVKEEMDASREEETASETVQKLLDEAQQRKKDINISLDSIKSTLEDLSAKVDRVKEEVNTNLAATIKTLEMMGSDIGDYLTSKVSLRELITYLIEDASSPEVVAREKQLPRYDRTTYQQVLTEQEVELPELADIKAILDKCQHDLNITFTKHSVHDPTIDTKPLSNLQRISTIQAGNNTTGLAVDCGRQRLVVRRMDTTAPISVYDFQGQQLHVLGQNVEGIAKTNYQGIALDTTRDLYLVPMADGSLVTLHTQGGAMGNRIHVTSNELHGVGYSHHGNQDIYLVSSYNSYQVFLVNADSHQVMTSFSPSTAFSYPLSLCDGHFYQGTMEHHVIIVCNHGNHCIKLLDSIGHLLHTYGKEGKSGQGEGELYNPWGVSTDPEGRIIVCDHGNHRVLAFWREDGKDKWETLLDKDKLEGKEYPYHVTCDTVSRRLFVGYDDGTIHIHQ